MLGVRDAQARWEAPVTSRGSGLSIFRCSRLLVARSRRRRPGRGCTVGGRLLPGPCLGLGTQRGLPVPRVTMEPRKVGAHGLCVVSGAGRTLREVYGTWSTGPVPPLSDGRRMALGWDRLPYRRLKVRGRRSLRSVGRTLSLGGLRRARVRVRTV